MLSHSDIDSRLDKIYHDVEDIDHNYIGVAVLCHDGKYATWVLDKMLSTTRYFDTAYEAICELKSKKYTDVYVDPRFFDVLWSVADNENYRGE